MLVSLDHEASIGMTVGLVWIMKFAPVGYLNPEVPVAGNVPPRRVLSHGQRAGSGGARELMYLEPANLTRLEHANKFCLGRIPLGG